MRSLTTLILIYFVWLTSFSVAEQSPKPGFDWKALSPIAIQNRGRLKPLDTFARESAQVITGSTSWNGFGSMELLLNWLTSYDKGWEKTAFIRIGHKPLKKQIGLSETEKYFSPESIRGNATFKSLLQEAAKKQQRREKLNDFDRNVVSVQNALMLVDFIRSGEELTILPNPKGIDETWLPLSALSHGEGVPFSAMEQAKVVEAFKHLGDAYQAGDSADWNRSATAFTQMLRNEISKGVYPTESKMNLEIHYNQLRPFRLAWIAYLAGLLALIGFFVTHKAGLRLLGMGSVGLGLLLHSYGFAIRCVIAGRPPVTNMYESVIWVTWGCVVFAFLIWLAYRNYIIPAAASAFAVVGLVLADNLPSVLDPGIHPLEPVLRSNFWLTIHVLTITLGYAAFALSLCLGNVIMGYYLAKPTATQMIQSMQLYMYRAVQIGVVLLAAGTILGGVWADYSWGRFWGWDPKEVWALIALLLYLAVLHGRFTGWLKGFGFAATTVVCFLGVLMAWYGVNFVLGAGLHSYGFGTGGTGYVGGYVLLQVGFIFAAYRKYQRALRQEKMDTSIFPKRSS